MKKVRKKVLKGMRKVENGRMDQNIEMVAPAGAGGGWDTTARMAAQVLNEEGIIEESIGVVNKEGAGGAIGWSYIANQEGNPHSYSYHLLQFY